MRRLSTLVLLASLVLGTAGKLDRLSEAERTHFAALKPFLTDKDQKAYLKLKTEDERNAWLKARRLWDRYYALPERQREDIAAGKVQKGWTDDMVIMAWGSPHERRRLAVSEASRSELFVYFVEVLSDGKVMLWKPGSKQTHGAVDKYRWELRVYDHEVVQMERRPGWEG
ncbi:MAG: hypothetical protein H6732_03440 [Alphaproteobacteria bacterium]|nr:hypothetical protein [Alphaproteobacteria bacterium]